MFYNEKCFKKKEVKVLPPGFSWSDEYILLNSISLSPAAFKESAVVTLGTQP